MSTLEERDELLRRVRLACGSEVNWCIETGTSDPVAARAWLELGRLGKWGMDPVEVRLFRSLQEDSPGILGSGGGHPIDIVDLGCGDGLKGAGVVAALAASGAANLRYVPVDGCDELVEHAGGEVRSRTPGVNVVPMVGDFTQPSLEIPVRREARRLFLFLGNTISTFETKRITDVLASLLRSDDLLAVGLRYRKSPPRRLSVVVSDSSLDASDCEEIRELVAGYYDFNSGYPVFKAIASGLAPGDFEHHVEFDESSSRVNRFITIKRVAPNSELARNGLVVGQRIVFSYTRYESLAAHEAALSGPLKAVTVSTSEGPRLTENTALMLLSLKRVRSAKSTCSPTAASSEPSCP